MNKATLHKISDHVYWMPPAKPDRPSVCAVVGTDRVVMLDAGASSEHAREFLDQLTTLGISRPQSVVLTHWHWDHVFGAAEVGAQIIAQSLTAEKLIELSTRDWTDQGLEQQIATGHGTEKGTEHIKAELPAPRTVSVAQAHVIFHDSLEMRLGAVTCQIEHVGGDHAADSSVIFILPDRVLFLADCLCGVFDAPQPYYTIQKLLPLLDTLLEFDAVYYVEGHESKVYTRAEFEEEISKIREAVKLIEETGADEEKAFALFEAKTGETPDEDTAYYLRALIAGAAEQGGARQPATAPKSKF